MADSSHGHTPAAWTGVTIAFIGFCAGSVFTVAAEPVGVVASLVVVALGGVVGMVMRSMGMGQADQKPLLMSRPETEAGTDTGTKPGSAVRGEAEQVAAGS